MSFLGNSRPDLLRNNNQANEEEATPRGSEARFIGEVPAQAPEPVPTFGGDRYNTQAAPAPANSNDAPLAPDRCSNVVAAGARWKGSLKVEDSARIDGVFSGEIEAKGTVHVSEGAEVDAKIHAAFVVVSGTFRGEIRADRKAELMPTSRVEGEVVAKALSVHEGATLDGAVQMTGDAPSRAQSGPQRGGRSSSVSEASEGTERRGRAEPAAAGTNGNGA